MSKSRADQFAMSGSNFFHCYARCVRQGFLCGVDEYTGQNYEHRKGWIVERMQQLSQAFAIRLWSYAVMSNHYHIVVEVCSDIALSWDEDEVLNRWSQVFPRDAKNTRELPPSARSVRVGQLRERLGDLSKYMSCLNHFISVKANEEEDKTGAFWESRFKMKNLADEASIVTAMAYVDLNPIRAKIAKLPEDSKHTSIQVRTESLRQIVSNTLRSEYVKSPLQPVAMESSLEQPQASSLGVSIGQYLELVESTGRVLKDGLGMIESAAPALLDRLKISAKGWCRAIERFNTVKGYIVCHHDSLEKILAGKDIKRFRATRYAKELSG